MTDQPPEKPNVPLVVKTAVFIMGLVPLGIGLTVIGFLWFAPHGAFGSPPLFFRVFGSFIGLFFVAFGFLMCFSMVAGSAGGGLAGRMRGLASRMNRTHEAAANPGYQCPQCGARLGGNSDVSPHGDVKCDHCGCWFNIHGK